MPRALPWLTPSGWVAVGLGLAAFSYSVTDKVEGTGQSMMGTVSEVSWLESRANGMGCVIRADDGAVFVGSCWSKQVGARVPVCRWKRRWTNLWVYEAATC